MTGSTRSPGTRSGALVLCDLRVIDFYRLRYELASSLSAFVPLRQGAGIVVHAPDGAAVGTPAMLFSILWGDRKLPYEPGDHLDVPVVPRGYFATYAGIRIPAVITVDYTVERRLYVSEIRAEYERLHSMADAGAVLGPRGLGPGLSTFVIRRTWRYVGSAERLRSKPRLRLTVLDALA